MARGSELAQQFNLALTQVSLSTPWFRVPAPDNELTPAPMRFAVSRRPVEGHLIGVHDGRHRGWWGPVQADVASLARSLFDRAGGRVSGTPAQCIDRLRRTTRHAHSGVHRVSLGAIELAFWDLLGQRYGVPVWRLVAGYPALDRIPAYATCFGIRLDHPQAPEVVRGVGEIWGIQKWRPVRDLPRVGSWARRAAELAGPQGLALDFGGAWPGPVSLRYGASLRMPLAWMEEPCPPGTLLDLDRDSRPAPIAAGEHCYGADDTAVLVAAMVDVWQPDAVFCGGFQALRAIAARAAAAGCTLYPHGGGLIPAIHAMVAGSPTRAVEYYVLMEPRRQAHLAESVLPGPDGAFAVPQRPGWAGGLRTDLELW
jgi:D-galactarolactone cycloisomerase